MAEHEKARARQLKSQQDVKQALEQAMPPPEPKPAPHRVGFLRSNLR